MREIALTEDGHIGQMQLLVDGLSADSGWTHVTNKRVSKGQTFSPKTGTPSKKRPSTGTKDSRAPTAGKTRPPSKQRGSRVGYPLSNTPKRAGPRPTNPNPAVTTSKTQTKGQAPMLRGILETSGAKWTVSLQQLFTTGLQETPNEWETEYFSSEPSTGTGRLATAVCTTEGPFTGGPLGLLSVPCHAGTSPTKQQESLGGPIQETTKVNNSREALDALHAQQAKDNTPDLQDDHWRVLKYMRHLRYEAYQHRSNAAVKHCPNCHLPEDTEYTKKIIHSVQLNGDITEAL